MRDINTKHTKEKKIRDNWNTWDVYHAHKYKGIKRTNLANYNKHALIKKLLDKIF